MFVEERSERRSLVRFHQHGLFLGDHIEIHQRHAQAIQPARLAQQMPIHPRLRPMHGAVVVAHAVQPAAIGLDFFELVGHRVIAVGAAADQQAFMLA